MLTAQASASLISYPRAEALVQTEGIPYMVRLRSKSQTSLWLSLTLALSVAAPAAFAQESTVQTPPAVVAQTDASSVAVLTGAPVVAPPSSLIVIDNDDEKAQTLVEETYKWADVPDAEGKTKIATGATFPVRVVSQISSRTAKVGDPVEGLTRVDLKIGGKMIAPKGTRVVGHVFSVMPARRILVAELSRKRFFRANGEIGIQFDEIITKEGEHLRLMAKPARQARIVENKNEGRVLGVNHKGEVATPLSIQLKHQAAHLAIRGAASVGGVFSMGAVPVAYAALGAINPSFAFLHPVGKNVPHRRLKGAGMGLISGMPGGFLIADMIIKGSEASIIPGDEFLVEFKQDFTGEAATDAELNGATKDVHAEVVGRKGGKKSKRSKDNKEPKIENSEKN